MPIDRDDPFSADLLIDQSHYVDTATQPVLVVAAVKLPSEIVGKHADRIRSTVSVAATSPGSVGIDFFKLLFNCGRREQAHYRRVQHPRGIKRFCREHRHHGGVP